MDDVIVVAATYCELICRGEALRALVVGMTYSGLVCRGEAMRARN